MPVPLARRLLFQNKLRLAASVVGVAVAVLLVLQNLALYRGIQRYASVLVQREGGDLWIVSKGTAFFELGDSIPESTLYKVRSIAGVAAAEPLLYYPTGFNCPGEGNGGPINFVGVDPRTSALAMSAVEGDPGRLIENGGTVVDRSITRKCPLELDSEFKVHGVKFHVVGFTHGIKPLLTIPYAFVSLDTIRMYAPQRKDEITYVAAKAVPGVDLKLLQSAVARAVAPNQEALTYEEFLERHDAYWKRTADIRIILLVTSVLALFVGLLVVGQTVYSSTLEHLKQFGTLKAIGASNAFVTRVVLRQAMLAGALGFGSGFILSIGAGFVVRRFLPSEMTTTQVVFAAVIVTGICGVSALAPILRIVRLEPTEVFR